MKNYGEITADEILKNQVNMADEFNPLVASITPNTFTISGGISIEAIEKLQREIENLKGKSLAFVELSCKNCGAKIQQKYEDQIIKCPYCKSVYVIGTWRVNDSI